MKRRTFIELLGVGFLGGMLFGKPKEEPEPKVFIQPQENIIPTNQLDEGGYLIPKEYLEEVIRLSNQGNRNKI